MNFFSKCCLSVCLFGSLTSGCTLPASKNDVKAKVCGLVKIKNWDALGPFTFDTLKSSAKKTIYADDLAKYGIKEQEVSTENVSYLKRKVPYSVINEKNGFIDFFDHAKGSKNDKSNFYLFTNIVSTTEQTVVLAFDYSASCMIWLNHNQVFEGFQKRSTTRKLHSFIRVTLKKGNNNLLVKVNRYRNLNSWKLVFYITSLDYAREIYKVNYVEDFIDNPNVNDSILLYLGPYSYNAIKDLYLNRIGNDYNNTRINLDFVKPGQYRIKKRLVEGFYRCTMVLGNDTMKETIYKGNLVHLLDRFNRQAAYQRDSLIKSQLNLNIIKFSKRLRNNEDSISRNTKRESDKKRVFYATSAFTSLDYLMKGHRAFKNMPGTFFKAYYSKVERKYEGFLFHCDEYLLKKGRKIPLVLVIPYTLGSNELTDEGYYDFMCQIEADIMLADKSGFAIAWPFAGGKDTNRKKIDEDIKNVLAELKQDYPIDVTNICLMGDSEGAQRALSLATDNPAMFKALALFVPGNLDQWMLKEEDKIKNLRNKAIQIAWAKDDHYPNSSIFDFIKSAKKVGCTPKYLEYNGGHEAFRKDHRRPGFHFLRSCVTGKAENDVN